MAPGAVNGKPIENWGEWNKINQFLKQAVAEKYYNETVSDDNITTIELRSVLDVNNSGTLTTADAIAGNYNCTLFKEAATILAMHGVTFIRRIKSDDIRCEDVPYFAEEQKLFKLLEKENGRAKALDLIQKLKEPAARERMARLADNFFKTDEFSKSLQKTQTANVSRELELARKKIGQIQDKIRKIEMSNLPENEKAKLIEPLETMLDSLRRASATL